MVLVQLFVIRYIGSETDIPIMLENSVSIIGGFFECFLLSRSSNSYFPTTTIYSNKQSCNHNTIYIQEWYSASIEKIQHQFNCHIYCNRLCWDISTPYCYSFNLSLSAFIFPYTWKIAWLTPSYKQRGKDSVENFCPIAVIVNLTEIFESCLHKVIYPQV